jgi:subtilisin family serine protease
MKTDFVRACIFPALTVFFFSGSVFAVDGLHEKRPDQGPLAQKQEKNFKKGELIVKFKKEVADQIKKGKHDKHGAKRLKQFKHTGVEIVQLATGMTVEEAIARYMSDTDVEYAEPNYIIYAQDLPKTFPDDPYLSNQWGVYGSLWSPGIMAPEAWSITTGNSDVVIAVIDSGVDYTHADLTTNIWVNPGEISGNGIDDDNNGYIDDIHGINAINGTGNPMDDGYHGTHVAGTIGAVGNNAVGITGVSWNTKIMACKFMSGNPARGSLADALECLEYVKEMKNRGVNVVATNNSYGDATILFTSLFDAINQQRDILFVQAAGNARYDVDYIQVRGNTTSYSRYYLPNYIVVGATTKRDELWFVSNYGRHSVHVGAPGDQIYSTIPNNGYQMDSGTSMAVPHVAGNAALIASRYPTKSAAQIRNLILSGGDVMGDLVSKTLTGRRINAYGSLTCSNSPVFSILKYPMDYSVGVTQHLSAISINCDESIGPVTVTTHSGEIVQLHDDGVSPDLAAGDGIFMGTWTPSVHGDKLVYSSPIGTDEVVTTPLSILTTSVKNAFRNTPYSFLFKAYGGVAPHVWRITSGSLPSGLSLTSPGEIVGIPAETGSFSFGIEAKDLSGLVSQAWLTIAVDEFDSSAFELWGKQYDSAPGVLEVHEVGNSIASDTLGNVFVGGEISRYDSQTWLRPSDAFLVKYDQDGNVVWTRSYDTGTYDGAVSVAVDSENNIYTAGYEHNGINRGYLLVKYDQLGDKLWNTRYEVDQLDSAVTDMAIDASDNIYLIGTASSNNIAVFDKNGIMLRSFTARVNSGIAVDSSGNIYAAGQNLLIKHSPDGGEIWAANSLGTITDLALDVSGNVYISGAILYGSNKDYLIEKYSTGGTPLWSKNYDGTSDDNANDIAVDKLGNIYVTGYADLNFLTLKYSFDGVLLWKKLYDTGNSDFANGIAVDLNENVYVTGRSYNENPISGSNDDCTTVKYKNNDVMIANGGLASATINLAYNAALTATGGTLPYAWSLLSGALPDGVSLNAATGEIYGTPSTLGTFNFWILVTDINGVSGIMPFTIVVHNKPIQILSSLLPNGSVYNYYSGTLNADGGTPPYQWSITGQPLPNGLILNNVTGELSGIPANAGIFSFTVLVTDADSVSTSREFGISIFPYGIVKDYISVFDSGGNETPTGIAVDQTGNIYVSGNSDSGAFVIKFTPDGMQAWTRIIENANAEDIFVDQNGFIYIAGYVGNSSGYDFLLVQYDASGVVVWQTTYDNGGNDYAYGIAVDSAGNIYIAGTVYDSIGDRVLVLKYGTSKDILWTQQYDDGYDDRATSITVDANHNVYIGGKFNNGSYDYRTIKLDENGSIEWVRTYDGGGSDSGNDIDVTDNGEVHITGSSTINAAGGPSVAYVTIKYDAQGNELWAKIFDRVAAYDSARSVQVDGRGGVYVTGVSTNSNHRDCQTIKYDSSGDEIWSYTLDNGADEYCYDMYVANETDVYIVGNYFNGMNTDMFVAKYTQVYPLMIETVVLPFGIRNIFNAQTLTATGGALPYLWTIVGGGLPTGLTLNSATGEIAGVPTTAGISTFTVQVTDARSVSTTKELSIAIYEPLEITTSSLSSGTIGTLYSTTLAANGGLQPYTWSVPVGNPPIGLTLSSSTGEISGEPITSGTLTFMVQVTDAQSISTTKELSIAIYEPLAITTGSLAGGALGTSYSQTLAATGGLAPYTWTVASGSIPAGLSLNSASGDFFGTLTSAGTYSFTIQVADANGSTGVRAFTVPIHVVIEAVSGTNGAITPSGPVSVNAGDSQAFTITPNTGYHVSDVLVDSVSVGAVTTYTFDSVTANHTIQATFAINTYTVTPTAGPHGTISPATPQTVNFLQPVSFTITPNTGYHIASVTGCNGTLNGSTYTTGPVTADCTVSAMFAINTYALTVTKAGTGSGTVTSSPAGINCGSSCSATYDHGTVVTLTAASSVDSLFAGWSGGGCSGTGTCVTSMDAAKTATTIFNQHITVTVPNGGESWTRGTTYTIRWNYVGNPGSNVKIELLKGGVLSRTITSSTSRGSGGIGSYSWRISKSQATGSDYTIRVTSTSNSNYRDTSNGNFTIQ